MHDHLSLNPKQSEMAQMLAFTLQYPWQTPALVTAPIDEPLIDVLARNGYSPFAHCELFVAVGGACVDPRFSVSFCGVRAGSRVVILQRPSQVPSKSSETPPDARRRQIALMADRTLALFDATRKAPAAYRARFLELERGEMIAEPDGFGTVTEFDPEISEAPLPYVTKLST
jgi:hypothetical protein